MGRKKETSDAELLRVAQKVFLKHGHSAGTRLIAQNAGVSEAVLFQRFGTKERLFFRAMAAGPQGQSVVVPPRGAPTLAWFERTAVGLKEHFDAHIPVMLAVAAHPAFRSTAGAHRDLMATDHSLLGEVSAAFSTAPIRSRDAETLANALIAVAHSLALYGWMGAPSTVVGAPAVRRIARLLWRGAAP